MKEYAYPPQDHMWRDLNTTMECRGKECCTVRAPVVAAVCSDQGCLQAGAIATLADLIAGRLAAMVSLPDRIATTDLQVYSTGRARAGEVAATSRVVRAGRTVVVIEVDIFAGSSDPAAAATPIGSALAAFSRLRRREGNLDIGGDDGSPLVSAPGSGHAPSQHILEKAGLRVVDAVTGQVELDLSEYVQNSLRGLHGGMFGMLADVAGQHAARAVSGRPLVTTDLAIRYLSMGTAGPFRTSTNVLRTTADNVLTRVEIRDRGKQDLLMAVAMNTSAAA